MKRKTFACHVAVRPSAKFRETGDKEFNRKNRFGKGLNTKELKTVLGDAGFSK